MQSDHWQPNEIRRFVQGFPTSARTALVETDIGFGYLKAMGGPEGPQTLASEVVATQLGAWFGLSIFDWAIIRVDDVDEIPFWDKDRKQIGQASPGPAFITRKEDGSPWGGGDRELRLLANPQDISRLVVFDTWVLNCDRHSEPKDPLGHCRKPNRDNVFLSTEAPAGQFVLKAMDHTHCFMCGQEWTRKLGHVDIIKDRRVFGRFPEFSDFLDRAAVRQAATDLRLIKRDVVRDFAQSIPKEWDVKREALDALVDLVVGRASFVAETIEGRLWPQRNLFGENEEGSPES